jgi:molecular chaperone GrpE (heat shock protein)
MASETVRVPEQTSDPGPAETQQEEEAIESLRKEIERLKTRLEEERKKLNDVTCEYQSYHNLNTISSLSP